jgi:hypothetical protein
MKRLHPLIFCLCLLATPPLPAAPDARESVLAETLHPYTGPTTRGVDTTTLDAKVMCGYQGWFNAEGDGARRGWRHWTRRPGPLADGNAKFDLWPDVSDLAPSERFPTAFALPSGQPAEVFSSFNRDTVLRHFRWMRDYGIDGAFVQRFIVDVRDPAGLRHANTVLDHCRAGANQFGRAYAVMYDLSGLGADSINSVIEDWRALRSRMHVTDDPAYLHHHGKPLLAVWGVGFHDHRQYTLADCRLLVEFLKTDRDAGGCAVMLGVPTYWRDLKNDTLPDPALHDLLALADVISPWTVGRYRDPAADIAYADKVMKPDLAWCRDRRLDYLPVVFPGFSWHNMFNKSPSDQIPRARGQFLWSQFCNSKRAGASMIYAAMFDEVDEGTAIFKCTNDVPTGDSSRFLTYEGLPSDHYLWLTGQGARLLRNELPITQKPPPRIPDRPR